MGEECWSSFDGWFWIEVFHNIAIKLSEGLQLSEGFAGAEGFIPKWFTHMVLILLVRGLSFSHLGLLAAWGPLWHGSWLPPMQTIQEKAKWKPLCLSDLTMDVTDNHFYNVLLVTWVSPIHCGRGPHKSVTIRKQGSLGAILKAGYHNYSIPQQKMQNWHTVGT